MDFGAALALLKADRKVARSGWNGPWMWIALVPRGQWRVGPVVGFDHHEASKKGLPWIVLKTIDAQFGPWLPSQVDLLADHWFEVQGNRNEAQRPTIVCLCGSTRFSKAFQESNLRETLAGRIVLTIGCDVKSDDALGLGPEVKAQLDELHLRKIDLADEILVLNTLTGT